MLLRSLYDGVPIYTVIGVHLGESQFEHTLREGDPAVWTGKATDIDAAAGPATFYEVYVPLQGTRGWVWVGNIEEVK